MSTKTPQVYAKTPKAYDQKHLKCAQNHLLGAPGILNPKPETLYLAQKGVLWVCERRHVLNARWVAS
jgi:hypothetical protein